MSSRGSASVSSSAKEDGDPLWAFVEKKRKTGPKGGNCVWNCKYCAVDYQGTYTRVKGHLLKLSNKGIAKCAKIDADDLVKLTAIQDDYEQNLVSLAERKVSLANQLRQGSSDSSLGLSELKKRKSNPIGNQKRIRKDKNKRRASTYEEQNEQDMKARINEDALTIKSYIQYRGILGSQQTMLQDGVSTGSYYSAIMGNRADFVDHVVVNVGAGSGILSVFAAQAGARRVYVVEASEMAEYVRELIAGDPSLSARIEVIKGKIEEVTLPEKASVLISEPMGFLLVHERMIETYVIGRDRLLLQGGKMFPSIGRIHMAPFSHKDLHAHIKEKANFWKNQDFFGINLTSLHLSACTHYFSKPVLTTLDPELLVSPACSHEIDFTLIQKEELCEIDIPFSFTVSKTVGRKGLVHGLACWFDVQFSGGTMSNFLTTAPGKPTTHWNQVLCVLEKPLYTLEEDIISGRLYMVANEERSYTMHLTMSVLSQARSAIQTSTGKLELNACYDLKEATTMGDALEDYLWKF